MQPYKPECSRVQKVIAYHLATKHHLDHYARAPGYMEWATQPNPFRSYEGTNHIRLPFVEYDSTASYEALYDRKGHPVKPVTLENVAAFLELSLGLSAWKSTPGGSWVLRMNPSSGNLHPTEAHLLLPPLERESAGVFHYNSYFHALEPRAAIAHPVWKQMEGYFGSRGFLIALTSIFWREAWKYGERAFRYCQHDTGHALAALSLSAALLGWKVTYLHTVSDAAVRRILGFDRMKWAPLEEEQPEALCWVSPAQHGEIPRDLPEELVRTFDSLEFQGHPNRLSPEHVHWKIIDEVAEASGKPTTIRRKTPVHEEPFLKSMSIEIQAAKVIRQRRSAVSFDGATSISKDQFLSILDRTLPRIVPPFDLDLGEPHVHFLLFVHRVTGLESGLYFFIRNPEDEGQIRSLTREGFLWKQVENEFPLYQLIEGNMEEEASLVSCRQSIAGDSCFSLGMITKFLPVVEEGAYSYRHLFWETGIVGQVLYLEAEAHGIRSTGIGCFFDNEVHRILRLNDITFQSLYHFTMGGAVEDTRLQTWPPYTHLKSPGLMNT